MKLEGNKMAKRSSTRIAEHFCNDTESVRECEYQPSRFSCPVYSLPDNQYWAGKKPKDKDSLLTDWVEVKSFYDGSILLMCQV